MSEVGKALRKRFGRGPDGLRRALKALGLDERMLAADIVHHGDDPTDEY
jgi:hypothetical protein